MAPANLAAALVVRVAGERLLVVERSRRLAFLGGFTAFPGGKIEESDAALALQLVGTDDADATARIAALRELFEETGLFLAGDRLHAVPAELRQEGLAAAAQRFGVRLRVEHLQPAGRWITPDIVPIRFDTQFFFLEAVASDAPAADGQELAKSDLCSAEQVLAEWRLFQRLLATPTQVILEVLAARPGDPQRALEEAAEDTAAARDFVGPKVPVSMEAIAGIRQLPLRTPTLPPAQHTNCYLVGHHTLIAVDPATYEDKERARLLRELELLEARGARLERVILTHHHVDHIGSAEWLSAQRQVPIAAHPRTQELLRGHVRVDETLNDGDRLDLGQDASGRSFVLDVLYTPGHDPGHLVLVDRRPGSGAFIVGDMIASNSTIIIDPPEGDMAEYLRQLTRLLALKPRVLLPSHGPGVLEATTKLEETLQHRAKREAKIATALAHFGPCEPEALLPDAYDDTHPRLYPLAARSCLAHLLKLVAEGKALQEGGRFVLA